MEEVQKTILIYNGKGSVGKTPISFNIAYDYGMKIQTNNKSALIGCYKDKTTLTKDLTFEQNTLYDLGGFAAANILSIAKQVDLVIIPVFNDPSSLIQTKDTLKQILPIAKKVIIVTTKTENNDSKLIQDSLNKKYNNLIYCNLPLIKAFSHSLRKGKSIKELIKTDSNQRNWFGDYYKTSYEPFVNQVKKELGI